MSCCTRIYDLGCFGYCQVLQLDDFLFQKTGVHCFVFEFAGNTKTVKMEGEAGQPLIVYIQHLNEDGCNTFWVIDPDGAKVIFEKDDIEYDCFKISVQLYSCNNDVEGEVPDVVCDVKGQEGDILVWCFDTQKWVRYSPGDAGYVLTSNGAGQKPTWQPGQGGGGGLDCDDLPGCQVIIDIQQEIANKIGCDDVPGCETDPTVPGHVKTITSDQTDAMDGANLPSAANPFATMDDVGSGGVQTVTGNLVDNTDPANPVISKYIADVNNLDNITLPISALIAATAHIVQVWIDGELIQCSITRDVNNIYISWGYTAGLNSYIVIL
jgi:hypothetical protein